MSYVNFQKKIVFIHIPKTGGTSMTKAPFINPVSNGHMDIKFFYDRLHNKVNLDEFFKFAFVRNPYTRFASGVVGHIRSNMPPEFQEIKEDKDWRDRFTDYLLKHFDEYKNESVLRTQFSFVSLRDELSMNFIGKFESISQDWKRVCQLLEESFELPKLNESKYEYEWMLVPEIKKFVADAYAVDFQTFGYSR